jgi:RNA polymerase sigma-70 factor (ECF subfamily)
VTDQASGLVSRDGAAPFTGGDAAGAGGESAFAALTERYRRELHVHCYRMLASFDEAEDAVQETLLRAWRARDSFDGRLVRAWLYRIATNVCLDAIRRSGRRLKSLESMREVSWITPYPDRLLDEMAPSADEPDAVVVTRETIELAFLAALQVLPPRQRATLIARDVLGWPAVQTADALDTTVAAVNSALQRARATLQTHLPARRSEWRPGEPSDEERSLLARFIEAHEHGDAALAVSIAASDLRITMPPAPMRYDGLDVIGPLLERALSDGDWRLLPTMANRMPTAASYIRSPGDTVYRAFKFDVLRVVDGRIAEITTLGPMLFPRFGLPAALDG